MSSEPPAAFGFLSRSPAPIDISDVYLDTYDQKSMTLAGGHLNITNAVLNAPGGTIDLVSANDTGELFLNGQHHENLTITRFGAITIDSDSLLTTTGGNGGSIRIKTGKLLMDDSSIESTNQSFQNGGLISIDAQADIQIQHNASVWCANCYFTCIN